jgi:hypothetical protein
MSRGGVADAACWPFRTDAPADQQARAGRLRFKEEFPTHQIAPVSRRNCQHKIALRFDSCYDERICAPGSERHDISRRNMLKLWDDLACARLTTIVYPIIAVPASASGTHLQQPWPYAFKWRADRDGMTVAAASETTASPGMKSTTIRSGSSAIRLRWPPSSRVAKPARPEFVVLYANGAPEEIRTPDPQSNGA